MQRSLRRVVADLAEPPRRFLRRLLRPRGAGKRKGRPQLELSDEELKALHDLVLRYPWMGGKKGRANLIHDRQALVGAGTFDEFRHELASMAGVELARRRGERPAPPPFELPRAEGLNDVWAADGLKLRAWGVDFEIVGFLDVFNQEYLAVEPTAGRATSGFVAGCFEQACEERGGRPPTVCTKTDRGSEFQGAFADALEGRTSHLRIPPGTPWFNGEAERGNRDLRAVIVGLLPQRRPRPGQELATMQRACSRTRRVLNERIARPSLGNVTPAEVARGEDDQVRQGNEEYVARQRQTRKERSRTGTTGPWRARLARLFHAQDWDSGDLLRFLRLKRRDYRFVAE